MWYELNLAEQRIREKAKNFKPELEVARANADQVLGQLAKDSALIDFKFYRAVDVKTGKWAKNRLAACLFTPDLEAEQRVWFKDLGTTTELLKVLDPSGNQNSTAYDFLLGKFDRQIYAKQAESDFASYPRVVVGLNGAAEKEVGPMTAEWSNGCYRLLLRNKEYLYIFYSGGYKEETPTEVIL